MTPKEKNNRKTDQAWKQLHNRLEQDGLLHEQTTDKQPIRLATNRIRWVAAAIIALFASVATLLLNGPDSPTTPLLTLSNNEAATSLVTTLEDGSIVYLANQSRLEYPTHFQKEKREVTLAGNALFDVSGNRERPFLIHTEEARIEVIGTSFNVRSADKKAFRLSVRRGEVKVTLKRDGSQVRVKAGQTASIASGQLTVANTEDTHQFAAYTERIQFKDQRLADILRVINLEHSQVPIHTAPDLEDLRLTVSFHHNTPEMMAQLICIALNLKCSHENNTWIISKP